MINLALERVAGGEQKRRVELETLRSEIESDQAIYLERQRRQASKTFYHFGRLPIELASVIFSDVVDSNPAQVVGLSHVCRDWRRVVLEMPSLWSYLALSGRNPVAKAKTWKGRSCGRLKSLSISGENPRAMYALETLADTPFHRLHSLSLTSVDWGKFRQTLPLLSNDIIRQLETIKVDQATWTPDVDWFFELPDLQVRNLSLVTTDLNWRSLSDNCEHLVTFSYRGWFHQEYLPDLFALLHHNAKLEKLHLNMAIKGPTMFSPEQERRKPLPETFSVLPNLVELSLEGPELVPESLIAVMVPSRLQVLHLTKCPGPLDEALIHLLTREQPPHLQELVIDRCVIRDAHILAQILSDAPSLKVLRLMHLYNIKPVLDALSEPAKDSTGLPQVSLPQLERLDLSYCPEIRDGPIMRIVKLRIPPSPQLQEGQQPVTEAQVDGAASPSVQPCQLASLTLHGCDISGDVLPWLRKHVSRVDYKYATKKQANWKR